MEYIERLEMNLISHNRKCFKYRDGIAWDNKKKKTLRLQAPRGEVWRRLLSLEANKRLKTIREIMGNAIDTCSEI